MHVFVTGAAGFIGFHLAKRLLEEGNQVFGIDNLNAYYDPQLKADRLDILRKLPGFVFRRLDLVDREARPLTAPRAATVVVTVLGALAP